MIGFELEIYGCGSMIPEGISLILNKCGTYFVEFNSNLQLVHVSDKYSKKYLKLNKYEVIYSINKY